MQIRTIRPPSCNADAQHDALLRELYGIVKLLIRK